MLKINNSNINLIYIKKINTNTLELIISFNYFIIWKIELIILGLKVESNHN